MLLYTLCCSLSCMNGLLKRSRKKIVGCLQQKKAAAVQHQLNRSSKLTDWCESINHGTAVAVFFFSFYIVVRVRLSIALETKEVYIQLRLEWKAKGGINTVRTCWWTGLNRAIVLLKEMKGQQLFSRLKEKKGKKIKKPSAHRSTRRG